jgi:hypothetical protein
MWSVPRSYLEDKWGDPVTSELSSAWEAEERTSAREDEESPLLEGVARERMLKTQQAGKGLEGAVVICGD